MIPIIVDAGTTSMALTGRGDVARRRLDLWDEAGALDLIVFSDVPEVDLATRAGARHRYRLPTPIELADSRIVRDRRPAA